ncbi:uncharacterized protein [Littorina saxatilis]|uniref:uncharacterized protein isoform X2 n=1 Tax=Littorina saxatilis TaxID=31220 RepID=UPI0038B48401
MDCSSSILCGGIALCFLAVCHAKTFALSNEKLPWAAAVDQCSDNGHSCMVQNVDLNQWTGINRGPPSLPVRTPVWIGARVALNLMWRNSGGNSIRFFKRQRRCYHTSDDPTDTKHTHVYGPLSCLGRCGPGHRLMYLQGDTCYCSPDAKLAAPARDDQNKDDCNATCREEPYSCGGPSRHFTVYDISEDIVMNVTSIQHPCFSASFDQHNKLVVSGVSCDEQRQVLCLNDSFTVRLAKITDYGAGQKYCEQPQYNLSLPSKTSRNMTDEDFALRLCNATDQWPGTPLNTSFWVDLSARQKPFWITGEAMDGDEVKLKGLQSGCVAMETLDTGKLSLSVQPCESRLHHLCSCGEDGVTWTKDKMKKQKIEEAIAAGVTGIVFLVLFITLAFTLYVLKRAGRLHLRQKPSFNSTGEWDQTDDSSGNRSLSARLHREVYMAELQATLVSEKDVSKRDSHVTGQGHCQGHVVGGHPRRFSEKDSLSVGHGQALGGHPRSLSEREGQGHTGSRQPRRLSERESHVTGQGEGHTEGGRPSRVSKDDDYEEIDELPLMKTDLDKPGELTGSAVSFPSARDEGQFTTEEKRKNLLRTDSCDAGAGEYTYIDPKAEQPRASPYRVTNIIAQTEEGDASHEAGTCGQGPAYETPTKTCKPYLVVSVDNLADVDTATNQHGSPHRKQSTVSFTAEHDGDERNRPSPQQKVDPEENVYAEPKDGSAMESGHDENDNDDTVPLAAQHTPEKAMLKALNIEGSPSDKQNPRGDADSRINSEIKESQNTTIKTELRNGDNRISDKAADGGILPSQHSPGDDAEEGHGCQDKDIVGDAGLPRLDDGDGGISGETKTEDIVVISLKTKQQLG